MKNKIKNTLIVIALIIFWLSLLIYYSCIWAKINFSFTSFDEIIFTITSPVLNAGQGFIYNYFKECILPASIILLITSIIIILFKRFSKYYEVLIDIKIWNKSFNLNLFNNKIISLFKFCLFLIPLYFLYNAYNKVGNELFFFNYLDSLSKSSTFIEDNYVFPENVNLEFPNEKRNLLYIFVESLETTYANYENGGYYETNYIPELTKLAKKNINFSNTELLGGAYYLPGTTWTVAGITAQTAGIPIKTIFDGNLLSNYYNVLFPGSFSIGQILENNGYKNYMIMGSDSSYGSRDNYLKNHGNYTIYDYYAAIKDNLISEDYYVWWGYEDSKLFSYAKEKLLEISKKDEPFNFTLLTANMHSVDGYVDDACDITYDNHYLNSVACSDIEVAEFVKWIMKQDFYEDTTIIIVGDHLSMNNYSFDGMDYNERTVYNVIINSTVESKDKSNYQNRIFSSFDLYPTTLASMGVKIDGEKLGLGVNLFSDTPILLEEYGIEYVREELRVKSLFYENCILNGKC